MVNTVVVEGIRRDTSEQNGQSLGPDLADRSESDSNSKRGSHLFSSFYR